MATVSESKQQLHDTLERLENRLETPVVPGELESWTLEAQEAFVEMGLALRRHIDPGHAGEFAAIVEQDPELDSRVEHLRAEDKEIARRFDALRTESAQLTLKAKRCEPDEALAEHCMAHFVKRGLDLIIRIRKQEAALTTWYQEAFQRDRGVGD